MKIDGVDDLTRHLNDKFEEKPIKTFQFQNEGRKLYDKGLELLGQYMGKFQNNLYELKLNLQKH